MKLLKLFDAFSNVNYEFRVGDDLFMVEFIDRGEYWELMYFILDNDKWSVTKMSNSNPYRIVHKVLGECLNDFISKKSPSKIVIEGLPKEKQKEYVSPRTKLYVRYLKSNPPIGMSMTYPSGDIVNNRIVLEYIDNE